MQKRIEELAVQAGLQSFCVEDSPWQIEFEKFAGLIVQECLGILSKPESVMQNTQDFSPYNKGWVHGRLLAIEHINERFGVQK